MPMVARNLASPSSVIWPVFEPIGNPASSLWPDRRGEVEIKIPEKRKRR